MVTMTLKVVTPRKLRIRQAKPNEFQDLSSIDKETYYKPLNFEEFHYSFYTKNASILVIEYRKQIIGYFIVRILRDRYLLLRISIQQRWRRKKVGTKVLTHLKSKLKPNFKHTIEALVDERNLDAQLFLKANGFKWKKTLRPENSDHDLYSMSFSLVEMR